LFQTNDFSENLIAIAIEDQDNRVLYVSKEKAKYANELPEKALVITDYCFHQSVTV